MPGRHGLALWGARGDGVFVCLSESECTGRMCLPPAVGVLAAHSRHVADGPVVAAPMAAQAGRRHWHTRDGARRARAVLDFSPGSARGNVPSALRCPSRVRGSYVRIIVAVHDDPGGAVAIWRLRPPKRSRAAAVGPWSRWEPGYRARNEFRLGSLFELWQARMLIAGDEPRQAGKVFDVVSRARATD